jgi:tyrosine aminotransferase
MGINLPPSHLRAIVSLADRLKVLIIADEIYGHMSWSSSSFVPLARLSDTVPVLTISGLSKRFLVPGESFFSCHRSGCEELTARGVACMQVGDAVG